MHKLYWFFSWQLIKSPTCKEKSPCYREDPLEMKVISPQGSNVSGFENKSSA